MEIVQANLAQTMRTLKDNGVWIMGLADEPGASRIDQVDLSGPIAIVVGSEGSGIRPLIKDSCDLLIRLPMRGQIESLNAAVAGSIGLYQVWQKRGFSDK
jgi:23S rRNA (guanosine2251-2'-O)-methyltransferase